MIDFHLSNNQLELAGAICVAALAALSLFKLASGGIRKQIGRLSLYAKILLGFCIVDSIIVCGTKTNDPPRSAGATLTGKAAILSAENTAAKMAAFPVSDGAGRTPVATAIAARSARGIPISLSAFPVMVTPEDIARGYRIESVTTNTSPFAEMPSNAVEYAKWSLRGGYETWFPLDLGEFVFPLGTNFVNRFRVVSGGMVETYPALNGPASICAAREYALLIPGVSRFWSTDGEYGAKVLCWENVFANRDRTGEYSADMHLFPDGGFTTRSNEVETVFRRVNPYDWDGDGIVNEIDDNPLLCDGDFFGTANQLPTNANPDAYYWLDLAATGALGVARISVVCDGPSDLGDHSIIARTNQVCHIPLLIGATYAVESDLPISYSEVSSEYANISTNDEHNLVVSFPLEFSFEPMRASGSFRLVSGPINVGATLASISGGCCSCQTNEVGFSWICADNCSSGGEGYLLSPTAIWEGYSFLFGFWNSCPCPSTPVPECDPGDISPKLVLDSPNTLFTNSNGGAEDSDIIKLTAGLWSPVETNGTLTLRLQQGGIVNVWSTSNRHHRVNLPLSWDVESMERRNVYVEGANEVARGGEAFELEWRDGDDNLILSTNLDLAVYHPLLDVVNSSTSVDDRLCNPSGIVIGTNACFFVGHRDVPIPDNEIAWSIVEGDAYFTGSSTGMCVKVASDVPDQRVKLRAQIGDCRSRPPEISACVVEPQPVRLTVWIVGNDDGSCYPIDVASVSNMVAYANKVYEQIGVSFHIDTIAHTNIENFLDISNPDGSQNLMMRRQLVNFSKNTFGLEVYFIDRIAESKVANNDEYGIVVSTNWTISTLAHEIGHSFRCVDIYPTHKYNMNIELADNEIRQEHAPLDWNNGDGCRYYSPNLTQGSLIGRLLMCGYDVGLRRDIPSGSIYGFNSTNQCGMVDVGFFPNGTRRDLYLHQ